MSQSKFWQGWDQIAYGILGAVALYCLIVTAISYWEMGGLEKKSAEEGVIVRGVLEYVPKGRFIPDVGIRESTGKQWRCPVVYCSYQGIARDYGKVAEVIILGGQIVQIRVDSEIKLAKEKWEAAHVRSDFAITGLLFSLAIALIRFLRKRSA